MKIFFAVISLLLLSSCVRPYTFSTFSHGEVTYNLPPYGDKKIYYSITRHTDGTILSEKYGIDHKVSTVLNEVKGAFETIIEGGHAILP